MDNKMPSYFINSADIEQAQEDHDSCFSDQLNDSSPVNASHPRSSSHESMLALPPISEVKTDHPYDNQVNHGPVIDPRTNDPKRLKRLHTNRAAAQRSRLRKRQQYETLENRHKLMQAKVNNLHAQVHSQQLKIKSLQKENEATSKKLKYFEAVMAFKEAEYEAIKKEKEMLILMLQLKQQKII